LEARKAGCGIEFVIDDDRFEYKSRRFGYGTDGELLESMMEGESVSATYCDPVGIGGIGSRVGFRAVDEDEGRCRCCRLVCVEYADVLDVVLIRLPAL
jgi:hypothetical protein